MAQGAAHGTVGPLADPVARRREWRAWYAYDWANSAFLTTVAGVLLGPYVTTLAERAACGYVSTPARECRGTVSVLGVQVATGSLWLYVVTLTTLLAAVLLPLVGALVDRVGRRRVLLAAFAWAGSVATGLMVLTGGSGWLPVVALAIIAGLCAGAAGVVYNALLNDIASPQDRDGVSSRGWAAGYLGAGIMLVLNMAFLLVTESRGWDLDAAVRWCLLSAALWWGLWTLLPYRGLVDRARPHPAEGGVVSGALRSMGGLVRDLSEYPQTSRFIGAFVFYNAGIQVVLASAAVYATRELGHSQTVVIVALICVQFVAAPGALALGRAAGRYGPRSVVSASIVVWSVLTAGAAMAPTGDVAAYLALAIGTGLVLGGSQALSRSMFSRLIPPGREAEFFGLYQTADRATSWVGTLAFGLVFEATGEYRAAMGATVLAFVVGVVLLRRVDLARGHDEALAGGVILGNQGRASG